MKNKIVYYGLLAVLIGVFAFSAYKLGDYWLAKIKSDKLNSELSMFVGLDSTGNGQSGNSENGDPEHIKVDFESLCAEYEDIVAWIYCPNTKINYPIVQSYDNEYYLYRLLDGTWNVNGTIFMDYRNNADFSDSNTMIHGHHMKTGAMFGQLNDYKKQSFYEEHPYMYIYTPEQDYRIDLIAGCIVESVSDIYDTEPSSSAVWDCINSSTFVADVEYSGGKIVTLSTCTYEYDDARYVVLGELVPIEVEGE